MIVGLIIVVGAAWGTFKAAVQHIQIAQISSGPRMYIDQMFQEVAIQYNVTYSVIANQVLKMDVYQPKGDIRSKRPLLILIHGGGFYTGDKNIYGGTYDSSAFGWGRYFAERGYVVFSINYRLINSALADEIRGLDDPLVEQTVMKAKSDVLSSVRYARLNANEYGIDPNHIFLSGNSAGAVLALYGAYETTDLGDNLTNLGASSLVQGAVSLAGAIYPAHLNQVVSGAPPTLMFAGTLDTTVPYVWQVGVKERLKQVGVRVAWYSFPEVGHQVAGYKNVAPIVAQFLYELLPLPSQPSPSPSPSHSPSPTPSPIPSPSANPSIIPSIRPSVTPTPSPSPIIATIKPSTRPANPTPLPVSSPEASITPFEFTPFVWHGSPAQPVVEQYIPEPVPTPWWENIWGWIVGLFI